MLVDCTIIIITMMKIIIVNSQEVLGPDDLDETIDPEWPKLNRK